MAKILIVDVAASSGGAMTILKQYYNKAADDTNNEWFFLLSTPKFKDAKNIKIMNYPWIKKSWIHRMYFDKILLRKIIRKFNPDKIISLQNIAYKTKNQSELYLHQPLPFTQVNINIFKTPKLWIYKNIIGHIIKKNFKHANKIIVQTKWMEKEIVKFDKNLTNRISIERPILDNINYDKYKQSNELIFFYPASAISYKNHKIILEALKIIDTSKYSNFKFIFTLNGNESKDIKKMYEERNKYNFNFIGSMNYEAVIKMYSQSILIFPSYIETFGLPLLEARTIESPIIAAECDFAKEICDNYNRVSYFKYDDKIALSKIIQHYMEKYNNKGQIL